MPIYDVNVHDYGDGRSKVVIQDMTQAQGIIIWGIIIAIVAAITFLFSHLYTIAMIIGVVAILAGVSLFGYALYSRKSRPDKIRQSAQDSIYDMYTTVIDLCENRIQACDEYAREMEENLRSLPKDEKRLASRIRQTGDKLALMRDELQDLATKSREIWNFDGRNLPLLKMEEAYNRNKAELREISTEVGKKAQRVREIYQKIDTDIRKALKQPKQKYNEMFIPVSIPSTRVVCANVESDKDIKKMTFIGVTAAVIGGAIVAIASFSHATQPPEVAIITGYDGFLSSESKMKPDSDGIYRFANGTSAIKVCILNERGFGDGANASMSFDGGVISRVTDNDDDEEKGRACWTAKADTKQSASLRPGQYTITVRNDAGEVSLKVLVKEPE